MQGPVLTQAQVIDYLTRARALIEHGHIKGYEAVTEQNQPVEPWDEHASKWCEIGAVKAVTHYDEHPKLPYYNYVISILNSANTRVITAGSIPAVNDATDTDQQYVLRMFDRAIAFVQDKLPTLTTWHR